MIDKDKVTSFTNDLNLKLTLVRNLSRVDSVINNHTVKTTDFLNPYELKNFVGILKGIPEVHYRVFRQPPSAERQVVQIFQSYLLEEDLDNPVVAVRVTIPSGRTLAHRDFLGAILGLGITREKIGDIIVNHNEAFVMVDSSLGDYIEMNLTAVAREKSLAEQVEFYQVPESSEVTHEKIVYLTSRRADVVIAELFNLSRAKAKLLIEAERLKVNHEPVLFPGREVKDDSLISLKGYGRAYFDEVLQETKKGRLRVKTRWME